LALPSCERLRDPIGSWSRYKNFTGEHRAFDAYDLCAGSKIDVQTSSGFLPLLCKTADDAQARKIYAQIEMEVILEK
jgi:hypothetical protein